MRRLILFTLKVFSVGIFLSTGISKCIAENRTEENNAYVKEWALNVSDHMVNTSLTIEYIIEGNVEKAGKNGERRFTTNRIPSLKHIHKLAETFSLMGQLIDFVLSPYPIRNSSELNCLKHQLYKMNEKLDMLSQSMYDFENDVQKYSNGFAYINATRKISLSYGNLTDLISKLMNITCFSKPECRQKKLKLVDMYKNDIFLSDEVDSIQRGATNSTVFGKSLLMLISESSTCYIKRVIKLKSATAALVMKGFSALAFYNIATKGEYDMASAVMRFQLFMLVLEKETEDSIWNCYENINRYIVLDTINLNQILSEVSIRDANKMVLNYLSIKYPWIEFYVITANLHSKIFFWAIDSFLYEINNQSQSTNATIRNFVLVGSRNPVKERDEIEERFNSKVEDLQLHIAFLFHSMYDEATRRILSVIEHDKLLQNKFRSLIFLTNYIDDLIGYIGVDGAVKQVYLKDNANINRDDLLVYEKCKNDYTCLTYYGSAAVISTIFAYDQGTTNCSRTCGYHGTCFLLPHSTIMECKCDEDYYGNECNWSVNNANVPVVF